MNSVGSLPLFVQGYVLSMKRYSAWQLLKQGLMGQAGWAPAWRQPEPKQKYDVIIIGGGGHGLATAYYLAKLHGITNVALLEKGWILEKVQPLLSLEKKALFTAVKHC